jgi:hypothetical protein
MAIERPESGDRSGALAPGSPSPRSDQHSMWRMTGDERAIDSGFTSALFRRGAA